MALTKKKIDKLIGFLAGEEGISDDDVSEIEQDLKELRKSVK